MDESKPAAEATRKVTTKSGEYTATIRTELNFEEYSAVQEILADGVTIDPTTKRPNAIPGSIALKANWKAAEYVILEVTRKDGTKMPDPFQALKKMTPDDGQDIMDEVAKVWQRSQLPKKN